MEYHWLEGTFPKLARSAVTLGKFDGVHRGHRKLIDKILERKAMGEQAVLVAFVSGRPTLLTSLERRHYLESLGIDVLLECPLTQDFCNMHADTFIKDVLMDALDTRFVAVGEDYRFGYGRAGDTNLLVSSGEIYGYHTEILQKEMDGDHKVSSTFIREELMRGNMEKVEALLGRPFVVEGEVLHGRGMGHKNFFATANLVPPKNKLMPPNGVYATISRFSHKSYTGITNVGYKPTVGEQFLGVETHLNDCEEDLYGKYCAVELKKFQRPEQKFESFEALKAQISTDIENGIRYFAQNPVDKKQDILYSRE
jgi:riboflavin kinase/FMN adenylyltransferase